MNLYSMRSKSLVTIISVDELPVDILSPVNCGKWLRNLNNRTSDITEGMSDTAQAPTKVKQQGCRMPTI